MYSRTNEVQQATHVGSILKGVPKIRRYRLPPIYGIFSTFLKPNLSEIIKHVREGTLDFVILKPIDKKSTKNIKTF